VLTTLSSTAGDTQGESGGGGGESGEKLDVADGTAGMSGGDDMTQGCKKVDLLFVIDNSGSMADEQINLVASFPAFIDGMRTQLAETMGYHVGVISSDVYTGDTSCLPLQEGALITATLGVDSSNATCTPFVEGGRYMTEQDDLESKFACAAQIGTSGDGNERPMQALQAAISSPLIDAGGCNEGFLRDDAILVVVLITDEEDDHEIDGCMQLPQMGSAGEPPEWFAGIVASKGGNEQAIVFLSLIGPTGADMCPPLDKCTGGIDGAEPSPRIVQLTDMFTYGFIGPICQPYGPFFEEAIGAIKSACDDFVPPG
jgi:hypothetical protein